MLFNKSNIKNFKVCSFFISEIYKQLSLLENVKSKSYENTLSSSCKIGISVFTEMFLVNSIDDIKNVLLSIDENTYQSKMVYVESNYHTSNDFVDFGIMLENKLKKLLNKKDVLSNN